MFDLTGRVALVTGAGQSVGAGIARCLAAQGAAVAVNDIVPERAAETAAAIVQAGGRAMPFTFDVTDRAGVDAAVAEIAADLGPIDVLVNNAGNAGAPGMVVSQFRDMDPDAWDRFIAVNLYGVLNCTKAVIDGMCERGWGRVITISSGAGVMGIKMGISIYGAAKSGSIGFMRHLAMEVARTGVTVNAIAPGLMGVQELTEHSLAMARNIPVGRLGAPEDIGAACVYLASEEAAWVTGQTLNVNGGDHTT
ncbi:MAG: SDR family oxidoreductase [Acidimicrobiia bacterium]|jgi:NAD(P)-dependent dehydrogenase (short-subunit alcohol dehydrogenase family)